MEAQAQESKTVAAPAPNGAVAADNIKISVLLKRGIEVVNKVTAKEMTLTKSEMIDLLNFETAVKFIIETEEKAVAEKAKQPS